MKSKLETKTIHLLKVSEQKIFLLCLLFSLIFHVFYLKFVKENKINISGIKPKEKLSRVRILFPKKAKVKKFQIVDSEKSYHHKKIDSLFLSEKNNFFKKQTVSKNVGVFKKLVDGHQKPILSKTRKKLEKKQKQKLSLANLGMQKFNKVVHPNQIVQKRPIARAGSSNDYIKDIPLGDMTRLNTTGFKFYGFYHRIKQKLEQYWGKSIQDKMYDLYRKNGRVPASQTKITSLIVSLDKMGKIRFIHIIGSSGVKEIDQVGIDSFKKAGPFPNPPEEMLKNGIAKIEWSFVLNG